MKYFAFKVIPQYCTAHPVPRIITPTKYNGGFPSRKARTQEKWAFRKAWLGKRGGNLWQRRKRQLSESFEIVESAKTSFLSRTWRNILDGLFLLNEHGDLYFLLHKNIVHIILLNLEKKWKNLSEGKKDIAESVRKTVTPTCKL